MSRRRHDGEQEFGSDSFLDIIANIVGILIILIVVAGVKVARQQEIQSARTPDVAEVESAPASDGPTEWPWDKPDEATSAAAGNTSAASSQSLTIPGIHGAAQDSGELESELSEFVASLEEPEPDDVDQELTRQIEALTLDLQRAQQTTAASEEELQQLLAFLQQQEQDANRKGMDLDSLNQQQQQLTGKVFQLQQLVMQADEQANSFRTTLASLNKRQSYVRNALKQVSQETQRLREVLETNERNQPDGERLNHRLSPVGKEVVDGELHFRLHQGRIAHVPLEALLDRLKTQVSSRRNVVMRFHRYEGMVGPVEGFRMQYIVQRQSVSPLESLQYGHSAFHIRVARWSILPAETLEAEPVETAVRIGSRFRQLLEATDPATAVTIWLYPDDFQHFHRLRELAHGLNLRVAARPLPEGTQIAGSPNGSRSSSQ